MEEKPSEFGSRGRDRMRLTDAEAREYLNIREAIGAAFTAAGMPFWGLNDDELIDFFREAVDQPNVQNPSIEDTDSWEERVTRFKAQIDQVTGKPTEGKTPEQIGADVSEKLQEMSNTTWNYMKRFTTD